MVVKQVVALGYFFSHFMASHPQMKNRVHFVRGCSESTYDAEFLHLMRGKEGSKMTSLPKIDWLDQGQLERVVRLEKLPAFKGLATTVESSQVCRSLQFSLLVSC